MKPWLHQSLLTTSTYYSDHREHLQLSFPLTHHGGHREPLLHPYWPRPLSLADGPAGLVLKPVAVRLTNIYDGLPMSLNLLGPYYGSWEASRLPKRVAGDADMRATGERYYSPGTPTSGDTSTAVASSTHLSQLLSGQSSMNGGNESTPQVSRMFKDLLSIRMQILQDKATSSETGATPPYYGHHTPQNFISLPSFQSKPQGTKADLPNGTHSELNVAVIPTKPKKSTARRDTPEKSNSWKFDSKAQIGSPVLKKSKKIFTSPLISNVFKKRKYERAKYSEEYVSDDLAVKENKDIDTSKRCIASCHELLPKLITHPQISNRDCKQEKQVDLTLNNEQYSKDKTRSEVSSVSRCERIEDSSLGDSSNLCRSLVSLADDKKTFSCPQCRYITDRKNNLKRHIVTMHQESSKTLECCGVVFQSKASLRDHNSVFHRGGYRCQICSRNFCRKALLRRHLTVHSGQKDFFCTLCGYATSHKSNLERHQKVHNKNESTSGVTRREFLNRRKDCRTKKLSCSESFKKSQNLYSGLIFPICSKSVTNCDDITKNNGEEEENIPNCRNKVQETVFIKEETLTDKKTSEGFPIPELLNDSQNLDFKPNSTINGFFVYSNEPERHYNIIDQSNEIPIHSPTLRLTSPVITKINNGQPDSVGSKNPPSRVSKNKAPDCPRHHYKSSSLYPRKRLFPVRYECTDCKAQFSLQSDLGMHELQCKKKLS